MATAWQHQQVYVGITGTDAKQWPAHVDELGQSGDWFQVLEKLETAGYALVSTLKVEPRHEYTHSEGFLAFFRRPAEQEEPEREPVLDRFLT